MSFPEVLTDACVMECYFRGHMAERDLLFHDTLTPRLATYTPAASAAQQRAFPPLSFFVSFVTFCQSPILPPPSR